MSLTLARPLAFNGRMAETFPSLIAQVEVAQAALVALVRADLETEVETQTDQILARAGETTAAMQRLGKATERLIDHCRAHGVPGDAREKLVAWQREIGALMEALGAKSEDLQGRRALIRETLSRLTQASKGFEGYRTKVETPRPRFIRGQA